MGRWTETKCDAVLFAKFKKIMMEARDAVAERQKMLGHRMTTYEEIVRSFDSEDDQPASFVEGMRSLISSHFVEKLLVAPSSGRSHPSRPIFDPSRTSDIHLAHRQRQQAYMMAHRLSMAEAERDLSGTGDDSMNSSDFEGDCDDDEEDIYAIVVEARERALLSQRNALREARLREQRSVGPSDVTAGLSASSRPIRRLPTRTSTIRPPRISGAISHSIQANVPGPSVPISFAPSAADPYRSDDDGEIHWLPSPPEPRRVADPISNSAVFLSHPDGTSGWTTNESFGGSTNPLIMGPPGSAAVRRTREATTGANGRTRRPQAAIVVPLHNGVSAEFERAATASRARARHSLEEEDHHGVSVSIESLATTLRERARHHLEEENHREDIASSAEPSETYDPSATSGELQWALRTHARWVPGFKDLLTSTYPANIEPSQEATQAEYDLSMLKDITEALTGIVHSRRYDAASMQPRITRYLGMVGHAVTTFMLWLPDEPAMPYQYLEAMMEYNHNSPWEHLIEDAVRQIQQIDEQMREQRYGPRTTHATTGPLAESTSTGPVNVMDVVPIRLAGNQQRSQQSTTNPVPATNAVVAGDDDDDLATQATSLLESAREARENVMALIDNSRDLVESGGS